MYSWRERHMNMAKKYTFTFLPTGSFNYTLARTSSDICLNPRIHMGCDTDAQHMNVIFEAMFQSTHPHRIRQTVSMQYDVAQKFQSTHPHRMRLSTIRMRQYSLTFQSTHPHRMRPARASMSLWRWCCFNPRTHIGCDLSTPHFFYRAYGFNPRTHIGCDYNAKVTGATNKVSIHAPT